MILLTVVAGAIGVVVLLKDRSIPQLHSKLDSVTEERQTRQSTMATVSTVMPRAREELDDPKSDGWATEAFHEKAKKQLQQLGNSFKSPDSAHAQDLAALITAEFSCTPLLPQTLKTVFEDKALIVRRASVERDSPETFSGAEGLADAINQLCEPFAGAEDVRFEFKVFRVTPSHEFCQRDLFCGCRRDWFAGPS